MTENGKEIWTRGIEATFCYWKQQKKISSYSGLKREHHKEEVQRRVESLQMWHVSYRLWVVPGPPSIEAYACWDDSIGSDVILFTSRVDPIALLWYVWGIFFLFISLNKCIFFIYCCTVQEWDSAGLIFEAYHVNHNREGGCWKQKDTRDFISLILRLMFTATHGENNNVNASLLAIVPLWTNYCKIVDGNDFPPSIWPLRCVVRGRKYQWKSAFSLLQPTCRSLCQARSYSSAKMKLIFAG